MNTTDLDLTPARKERLTDLAKLKAWQILLGIFFVFALFLPSLASPPVVYTFWSVACSVLLYRWWIVRTTARSLLSERFSGRSITFICWRSIWSVAWKSFIMLALLPCLAAALVAPEPYYVATAIFAASTTWSVSLVFGADAAWGVARRMNPSASTSIMFGVVSIFSFVLAVPALIAGLAARKQLSEDANEEIGMQFARVGIGFGVVVLVLNIVVLSYFALTGSAAGLEGQRGAPPANSAAQTPTGPPPSGTAKDLHERAKVYGNRFGDPRLAQIIEDNFPLIKRLEDRSRDMIAAHNQLDPDVIFDPQAAGTKKVTQQLQVLDSMQNAALAYKDAAVQFRGTMAAEISKTHSESTQFVAETLDKSQPGTVLALAWSDTALAFSGAGRRFLQTFQDTGEADIDLLQALAGRAEEYEVALDRMQQRIESNQAIMHEHLPR